MSEIYHFKVYQADAQIEGNGFVVRLFYPRKYEPIDKRLDENLEFGVEVFERLIAEGYSKIANANNPIKPASAGSLPVFADGKLVCHRRDKFAPSHKLYHSAYAGYTQSREFVFSATGLESTALRESAEECLFVQGKKAAEGSFLVTRDKEPFLGPDCAQVIHPHVWAPEDLLTRTLDALGVPGYEGRWMELELWKEKAKLNGQSLLPADVLVR